MLLGNEGTKETGGVHLNLAGGQSLQSRETPALIYLLPCFIRTPLTAAGPFVLLILAIKHACRGRSRIGGAGGGFIPLNGDGEIKCTAT